jgi:hypothetical protein
VEDKGLEHGISPASIHENSPTDGNSDVDVNPRGSSRTLDVARLATALDELESALNGGERIKALRVVTRMPGLLAAGAYREVG